MQEMQQHGIAAKGRVGDALCSGISVLEGLHIDELLRPLENHFRL
jgi:hypothetical protein